MKSIASTVSKAKLQTFEALLDEELRRRPTNGFAANATLALACNMVEAVAARESVSSIKSMLTDGIQSFAPYLVSGKFGTDPDAKLLLNDLMFGSHYHYIRDLLYYSYNAAGVVEW